MDWLPPSLTGSLLATLIMVAFTYFLHHIDNQRYLLAWARFWALFSLMLCGEIALVFFPESRAVMGLTQLANLCIGFFLAQGCFHFMERPFPRLLYLGAALAVAGLIIVFLLGYSYPLVSMPSHLFIGLASFWAGWEILRSPDMRYFGGRLLGWSLVMWGPHRALFPQLNAMESVAPANYLVATLIVLGLAGGLIISYFQRTKTALTATEQNFRRLLESANDAIYVVAVDDQSRPLRFIEANQVAYQRLGYTREEFFNLELSDIIPYAERQRIAELSQALIDQGRVVFEGREVTRTGQVIPVDVSLKQALWGGQRVTLSISRDISDRKKAQAKLSELASIVANSQDSIISFDLEGIITSWNLRAQKLSGYTDQEAVGMSLVNLWPPEGRQRLGSLLESLGQGKVVEDYDTLRVGKNGRPFSVSVTISPLRDESGRVVGASSIGRDITAMKRQQEERDSLLAQLRRAQKMEALGSLAGGIAHDFNNILSVIMGNAEMGLNKQGSGGVVAREMADILQAGRRARDLVRQILTFSRQSQRERRPVALKLLAKEALRMLRSSLPAPIQIVRDFQVENDLVLADPTQLHQVLMNLCTNAAQAMSPGGGALKVALTEVGSGDTPGGLPAELEPGSYLLLSVSDTGCGMTPEVLERALEPFFTTKEPGQGTGLGLSVVHGIVQSHGGALRILSRPGAGSTFEVFLPRLEAATTAGEGQRAKVPRGTERVLLVEDEASLCLVECARLEWLGYRVSAYPGGEPALQALREGQEVDLLITDLVMPGLSGLALARQVRLLHPGLPVIVCTGHTEQLPPEKAQELGINAVLYKPVSLEEMSLAIRGALDRQPAADSLSS